MANSALVMATSPNLNVGGIPRNRDIDSITLRTIPGYHTCKSIFSMKPLPSCNYIVDSYGKVGLIIDENLASSCTENNEQNHRAITILISTEKDSPYDIATRAYNKLIDLLADICSRYPDTINQLVWSDNEKSRTDHENGSNISFYRDFTDTHCFDTTLFNKAATLVARVNATIVSKFTDTDNSIDNDASIHKVIVGNVNIASSVSKLEVISANRYLSQSEMEINARYIWQFFGKRGWTLNAVAGMLGNIQAESTVNPGLWQNMAVNRGPAFGLTQWDPFRKIITWQQEHGYEIGDIDGQLLKIQDELEMDGKGWVEGRSQWIATSRAGADLKMSFKEFSESTDTPERLAVVFVYSYERPGVVREAERVKWAKAWYDFLLPYSTISPALAYGLHLTNIEPDSFEASCYLQNVMTDTTIQLSVIDEENKVIATAEATAPAMMEEAFFYVDNLTPDTSYKIMLTSTISNSTLEKNKLEEQDSSDDTEEEPDTLSTENAISFKTLPGSPLPSASIQIVPAMLPLPSKPFTVTVLKPESWGYWLDMFPSIEHGYEIQYIVNSKIVHVEQKSASVFKPEFEIFPNKILKSAIKPGDILQIGVRTWVVNKKGKTLYDNDYAKTSNAICLIAQEHLLFLNKR